MIYRTYVKHRAAMGREDRIDVDHRSRVMRELRPLLRELRQKLIKADWNFDRIFEADDCIEAQHCASLRACYEASRAKGGQMGALKALLLNPLFERDLTEREEFSCGRPEFTEVQPVCQDNVVRPFAFTTVHSFPAGETVWADGIVRQANKDISKESLTATIQAVLEPLKVRVISKGNAAPYYLAKLFQKRLHGIMREYPFLRLIGRELSPCDLFDLRANKIMGGEGPYGFASIDFAAATDNLSSSLSEEILDELILDFPDWWRRLLKQCLAPHYCEYPKIDGEKLESIQQMNGQLMGSIVSFLVLCLANVGVTLVATAETDPMDWYSRLKGVLINGDDNGFVCRKSVFETFSRWAGHCGLEMSVGKAYWHPKIFNINSRCFHFDLTDRRSTPKAVDYLNTGLFFGQGKVLARTDEDTSERRMSDVVHEVIRGALPGQANWLLSKYLTLHSSEIEAESLGRNLFIPKSLGGMGVTKPPGFRTKVTLMQRLLAGLYLELNPNLWLGYGPEVAPLVPERPTPVVAPWLSEVIKPREPSSIDRSLLEHSRRVKARLSISGWRRNPVSKKGWGHFPCSGRGRGRSGVLNLQDGTEIHPLGGSKVFMPAKALIVNRPNARRVVYKSNWMEDNFATYVVQATAGSVFSFGELVQAAHRIGPLSVQHRDRDHGIDDDLSVWGRLGRSLELDIEMDHELDSLLSAIRHF
jgi:hypothetical protein